MSNASPVKKKESSYLNVVADSLSNDTISKVDPSPKNAEII